MPVPALAVLSAGLVSAVGLTAAESCAAIRCGVNNFRETRFIGSDGAWLLGSGVELGVQCRGIAKLAKMAAGAIVDCLAAASHVSAERVPVIVCIAEPERLGGFEAQPQLRLRDIETELGFRLHPHSSLIAQGRVGGAVGILRARRMILEGKHRTIMVAGVDSFLTGPILAAHDELDRLLRQDNSNGFIPGEAAAAVLVTHSTDDRISPLLLRGLGFAREPAFLGSGKPLRGDGLVHAIRAALAESGFSLGNCDHRIADVNGEQYRFREAALALTRILRDRKVMFSLWHPADSIGEVGAATLPAMLAMLLTGAQKDYLPGPVFLGHLGNDDYKRAAFVTEAIVSQSLALEVAAEERFSMSRRSQIV